MTDAEILEALGLSWLNDPWETIALVLVAVILVMLIMACISGIFTLLIIRTKWFRRYIIQKTFRETFDQAKQEQERQETDQGE